MDLIDCPICGRKRQPKQQSYRRCRECHRNRRNQQYAERWREHAANVAAFKYENNPAFREHAIQRSKKRKLSLAEKRSLLVPANERDRVYFIQCSGSGFIKIGFTTKCIVGGQYSRLSELQIGNPYPLKLLCFLKAPRIEELRLHRRFERHHFRGEWFYPAPELMAFIESAQKEQ